MQSATNEIAHTDSTQANPPFSRAPTPKTRCSFFWRVVADFVDREEALSANAVSLANLPPETRQSELRDLLSGHGNITSIRISDAKPSSKDFSRPTASAIVIFEKSYEAEKAQSTVDGRYLHSGFRISASWGDREQIKRTPYFPFP
jgi:RNA recognition motif. (a.k.a. RRM, RBD, or RNP domain)